MNRCHRAIGAGGFKRHGRAKSPEYVSWCAMLNRCYNKSWHRYDRYGGRGIKVCERWHTFTNFLEDMGNKPTPKHTLERTNNDADYCPQNCVWSTREHQANNTRRNVKVVVGGVSMNLAKAVKMYSIPRTTLYRHVSNGSTMQEAVTELAARSAN